MLAGVLTLDDALAAIDSGVEALKFYPASLVPPSALAAVLADIAATSRQPPPVLVAGGVQDERCEAYMHAGAQGFAIGVDCRQSPAHLAAALAHIKRLSTLQIK
jgi:2-dehydro-3-deoxyphosphogalactonate aldolase